MKDRVATQLHGAWDSLIDARVLFDARRYPAVLNRTYYVMFYAATAMLLEDDVECDSHYGVKIKFSEMFVKSGRVDKRFGRLLSGAFDRREDADYVLETRASITRETAQLELSHAEGFLAMAEKFLEGT